MCFNMVPPARLELAPEDWLLRPACLPIPPQGQMLPIYRGNYSVSELQLITYTFHPLAIDRTLVSPTLVR